MWRRHGLRQGEDTDHGGQQHRRHNTVGEGQQRCRGTCHVDLFATDAFGRSFFISTTPSSMYIDLSVVFVIRISKCLQSAIDIVAQPKQNTRRPLGAESAIIKFRALAPYTIILLHIRNQIPWRPPTNYGCWPMSQTLARSTNKILGLSPRKYWLLSTYVDCFWLNLHDVSPTIAVMTPICVLAGLRRPVSNTMAASYYDCGYIVVCAQHRLPAVC